MTIQCYDEDPGSDDLIGEATIKLSALCVNGGLDEWFQIAYRGKSSGQVHLKAQFTPAAGGAGGQGAAQQAQPQMMMQPGMQ